LANSPRRPGSLRRVGAALLAHQKGALFFSDDAVGIETALHQRLADKRVNLVNPRREFFHATAAEVKTLLAELAGDLLHFEDFPEALEYRQSLAARTHPEAAHTA
jgi:hypothetical protein